MKKLITFFLTCLLTGYVFSQILPENPDPHIFRFARPAKHSGNLKSSNENPYQGKSFYEAKNDWQTIIDTTWGPGLPLNTKLAIFDEYTDKIKNRFEGFSTLGIDPAEWNSIKASYRSRINASTSKGAFAALMGRLAYSLRDLHTLIRDTTVIYTPLNPGVPILVIGSVDYSHFGAVLTTLPDSSLLVLRTVDNHPLGLQPGDIVLGYEGVPWKDLVDELLASGIPIGYTQRGAKSARRYVELISAGMNWHLFDTIDIVKYGSGDTVHLPVYPLQNLSQGRKGIMWNNEQLPVPGVPFQDPNDPDAKPVIYGIVEGTNIGYIYVYSEVNITDNLFYEAVKALYGTDGLIIDLRINFGGWSVFDRAFNLLFNTRQPSLEDAVRCNGTNFNLCPLTDYTGWDPPRATDPNLLFIPGNPMSWYDKPLAVLVGPNCWSCGDITAYRLGYHPMSRFFGKSTCASPAYSEGIIAHTDWYLNYSTASFYKVKEPGIYLNRREFPVDDSIWFDKVNVANGIDAVAKKAVDWIQNLSYARNIKVNPYFAVPGTDTITLTAQVINPDNHYLSVKAFITSLDKSILDTVSLVDDGFHNDGNADDGILGALWSVPDLKTIFTIDVTTEDLTALTSRTIPGAAKFTTLDPVVFNGITYTSSQILQNCGERLYFKLSLKNTDSINSSVKLQAKITSLDTSLANIITVDNIGFPDIAPGKTSTSLNPYGISIPDNCPVDTTMPVKVEISSDFYTFWSDTFSISKGPVIKAEDDTICNGAQTNIDAISIHVTTQKIYYTYTSTQDNEGAVTGNTSNAIGIWEKFNIKDTLYNTTDQKQRIVYEITPYLLKSDNNLGCPGVPITVNMLVEPTVIITAENDTICDGEQTDIDISSIQEPIQTVYYTYTSEPDNAGAVKGDRSNTTGLPITIPIEDTLYNTTDTIQKVVYTIIPHVLTSDGKIGCDGTDINVEVLVNPFGKNKEDIISSMVRIYPNPVTDNLFIKCNNATLSYVKVSIVDVAGRTIVNRNFDHIDLNAEQTLDLSFMKSGLYFLEIRSDKGSTVYKIIKE